MKRRGGLALIILALWLAGVAALVHREFREPADQMALAGLLVTPASDFRQVVRDREHIGFSSFTVDTVETGIELNEYAVLDIPRRDGGVLRVAHRHRARMSRSLKLESFLLEETVGSSTRTVYGRVEGDSVIALEFRGEQAGEPRRVRVDHPVLPTIAVPIAMMLSRKLRVGRSYEFSVFDTEKLEPTTMRLRVIADSTMIFADSARFDDDARAWVMARTDTVRAWRVQEQQGPFAAWIDEQGRLVEGELLPGIRQHRTAYEMAYINWPGSRFSRAATRSEPRAPNSAAQ